MDISTGPDWREISEVIRAIKDNRYKEDINGRRWTRNNRRGFTKRGAGFMSVVAIVKWLLAHKSQAMQIYAIVQKWSEDLDILDKWKIVSEVAEIVIPILASDEINILSVQEDDFDEAAVMALGGEVQALGIPWIMITTVILPVMQIVFDFVRNNREE